MTVAKERVAIPKALRDQILSEFNHRCAVCGAERPQVHHIDENPANRDPMNLLPLCPNCHLTDQHNPTAPVDPAKLRLFREYKDPVILSPQFHPLYLRLAYLFTVETELDLQSCRLAGIELGAFVARLKMGDFYYRRIQALLDDSGPPLPSGSRDDAAYRDQLLANRKRATELIVEMLRYQDWPAPTRARPS